MSNLDQRIAQLSPEKRRLLELLAQQTQQTQRPAAPAPPRVEPVSFAQQQLWLIEQLEPGSALYTMPLAIRASGQLDQVALERSLDALLRRHEILRTSFALRDGQPVQVIAPVQADGPHLPLRIHDLRNHPPLERQAEALALAQIDAAQPFDLQAGPLIRATLVRLRDDDQILLLTMHHIISDGWSRGVLMREIAALYAAFARSAEQAIPALPLQYADFARWQREHLTGETLTGLLRYWRQQLQPEGRPLPILQLPTDRPRPPTQTYAGRTRLVALPPELTARLKALGEREGATLFMVLLTAFQIVLSRSTGQSEIVVGTPIANRTRVEFEALIGCFVNTLVLRTDLQGNPTFREALGRVRDTALGAYAHQDLPFELLVEELRPARDASRHPLFQVMFMLQNAPAPPLMLPGLTLERQPLDSSMARFDLSLSLSETGQGLAGQLNYNIDLFDAATIDRLAGHLETLLQHITADPDRPIAALPLLRAAERDQLLSWAATETSYPATTLHELIAAQAARTPEALAVICADEQAGASLSYAELERRADRLARHLRSLGLAGHASGEARVGVCMERTPALLVALLGILKAGAAYVPLDTSYPRERLAFIVRDAQVPVIVTQRHLVTQLPEHSAAIVTLDATPLDAEPGHETWSRALPIVSPEQPAYLIYTSGSTGQPKGVVVPHRGAVNFLLAMQREPGFTAADRVLAITTIAFDISVLELFLPLVSGATTVLVPRSVTTDGAELAALLQTRPGGSRVTMLQATPATWQLLLAAGWAGDPELTALCGGEPLSYELAQQVIPRTRALWNVYGPTETTVWSTAQLIRDAADISIGRPISNLRYYILDAHLEPVPIGVIGEICIGGAGVTRGYHGRPALTAAAFVPDPFGERVPSGQTESREQTGVEQANKRTSEQALGARMYRSGDLGRWRADGTIECLGRIDHQVKVRGFRIELGEIESVLAQHPAVQKAVVVTREERPGDKSLVAFVVGAVRTESREQSTENNEQTNNGTKEQGLAPSSFRLPPSAFRDFLKTYLPDYMIPALYVELAAWPLSPNGKIDRRALARIAADARLTQAEQQEATVAPRDIYETQLAQVFADVLGRPTVGVNDNFFDLGGTSLLAVRVMERIERGFGWQLAVPALLAHPTIAELAEILRQLEGSLQQQVTSLHSLRRGTAHTATVVELTPTGTQPPFFCVTFLGGVVPPTIFGMHGLARIVGPDQPFYGIQPPALYQDFTRQLIADRPLDNADIQMRFQTWQPDPQILIGAAAACVEALRAVQPHGPYRIGGVCSGGALALEIAQQLIAAGEQVAVLVLLDTPVPHARGGEAVPLSADSVGEQLEFGLMSQFAAWDLGGGRMAENINVLRDQLRPMTSEQRWSYILEQARAVKVVPPDTTLDELYRLYAIFKANLGVVHVTLQHYQPRPYPGRIALFQAQETIPEHAAVSAQGWATIARTVDVYTTPGDHGTMLKEPHVQVLAELLRQCLGSEK